MDIDLSKSSVNTSVEIKGETPFFSDFWPKTNVFGPQWGFAPHPNFFLKKNKFQGGTSDDDPINNYLDETCIALCSHIFSMGVATYVDVRVWNKEIKTVK